MKKSKFWSAILIVSIVSYYDIHAQNIILNKMKEKVENKIADELLNDKKGGSTNNGSSTNSSSSTNMDNSNNATPQNTKGGGLSTTTVDVNENIVNASTAYTNKNYSDAKYNIRQAIQAIEIEMGKEILKAMPETVGILAAQKENDKVTSTGMGFAGLSIERSYLKDDQQLSVIIANNSPWLSAVNMYLNNTTYATNNQTNYKQIKFQTYKAIIEYDENTGYKLSVPFGQTSIFVLNGINFENESKFMAAANSFNIASYQQLLGEK